MSYSITLLSLQGTAATISLIGAIIVILSVFFVMKSTGNPDPEEEKHVAKHQVYKFRDKYFVGLATIIVIMLGFTLQYMPYNVKKQVDKEVTVVAFQWGWKLSFDALQGDPKEFKGKNKIAVSHGETVKFHVTSQDATHNFGIYDAAGDIVAQTQAMPHYTNELVYQFDKPGEYKFICLEYCGQPHANMTGKIIVE
ncbi:MAG: cytochrome C oxidase subunit II [Brumimicrobium sp.]|nr:cytochrome C oxidase subunit II [Brumimicrobium sp.]